MKIIILLIASYIIGSIPNGYIISKNIYHIDITKYGSKNIGMTNVQRVIGNKPALIVFLLDFAKGAIAVILGRYFLKTIPLAMLTGIAAIIGHDYSIFMPHLKGGKGVSTSYGVMAFISFYAALPSGGLFFLIVFLTKYVSLASILSIALFPVSLLLFHANKITVLLSIIIPLLVLISHRENIKRLISGKERKIGEKVRIDQ